MKLGAPSPLGAARGAFYAFLLGMTLYTYRIAVDETASLRRELQQRGCGYRLVCLTSCERGLCAAASDFSLVRGMAF